MAMTTGQKNMQAGQPRFGLPIQNNSNGRNGQQSFAGIENLGRKNNTQVLQGAAGSNSLSQTG